MRAGHSKVMEGNFDCPEDGCSFSTDTEHGVRVHQSAKHGFDKTVTCEYCGETKEFPDKNPTELEGQKYCSRECSQNAIAECRSERVELECEECGTIFEEVPSRKDRAKYCSEECRIKNFTEIGIEKGKETRFSEDHEPWNKGLSIKESEKIQEVAEKCSKKLEGRNINPNVGFTDGHTPWNKGLSGFMAGDKHPLYKGGYRGSYGESWHVNRQKVLERDDHKCQYCGKTKEELGQEPDVHHIKPFREFDEAKEANKTENLICLCPKHHKRAEHNKIEVEQ